MNEEQLKSLNARSSVGRQMLKGASAQKASTTFFTRLTNKVFARKEERSAESVSEPLFKQQAPMAKEEEQVIPEIPTVADFMTYDSEDDKPTVEERKKVVQSMATKKDIELKLTNCDSDSVYWVMEAVKHLSEELERNGCCQISELSITPSYIDEGERVWEEDKTASEKAERFADIKKQDEPVEVKTGETP